MALIHRATLTPSKPEMLSRWLPHQPWCAGVDLSPVTLVGAFRFDDPAGEIGIETHLIRAADGTLLQVPFTYRGAPLAGASLIGTTDHSVLGPRWVYDGCTDPGYVSVLLATILTGGKQAEYLVDQGDGSTVARPSTALVTGSGTHGTAVPEIDGVEVTTQDKIAVVRAGGLQIRVARVVPAALSGALVLTGTWPGQDEPAVLAGIESY